MNSSRSAHSADLTRRSLLGAAGGASLVALLTACGSSAGSAGGVLKFWDMPWGANAAYNTQAKAIATAFRPGKGASGVSYQVVQWDSFSQTFASAIASKTGPAVSSGAGFQAYQYAQQGAIAYADNLVASLRKSGMLDDFLPGTVESLKTPAGYVAVPWQLDARVIWYRKSLLEQNSLEAPADWASWLTVAKTLAKKGIYSFGAAGDAASGGWQFLASMLINNGGGFFDGEGNLDCVTDRNIEALDFIAELNGAGAVDNHAVSYSLDNLNAQWKAKKVALGVYSSGLNTTIGDTSGDVLVLDPPSGPHGDKGGLYYVNNLMMYKNTPSQEQSEAFLTYYLKHINEFWVKKNIVALPALKSVAALPAFREDTQSARIIDAWQPVSKTLGATSTSLSAAHSKLDGSNPVIAWGQTVLAGKTSPRAALTQLQAALEPITKG